LPKVVYSTAALDFSLHYICIRSLIYIYGFIRVKVNCLTIVQKVCERHFKLFLIEISLLPSCNILRCKSVMLAKLFFLDSFTLKIGPIGCPETSLTPNIRCVTPQKIEDLIYIAAEPKNLAWFNSLHLPTLYLAGHNPSIYNVVSRGR